ncbi:MAG: hypothetical protein JWQ08_2458 [Deinococcus sp.]|nr:hypothetical protein [Deinococcus sp.]
MTPVDLACTVFALWQAVWSVAAFVAIWRDKTLARGGQWRISEQQLHRYELLGGWLGSGLAQRLWHHKTLKASYQQVYRRIAVIWLLACAALLCVWIASRLNG